MKLRCDLHVNGGMRKLLIVQGPNEPAEHMALKLSAFLLFWDYEPILDAGVKTPALANFEFLPDVLALDEGGAAKLWVECGSATMHKLSKLTRRLPQARLVVIKESPRQARRLREDVEEQLDRPGQIEIIAWPDDAFADFASRVREKNEVYGEAGGLLLNLVLNDHPVAAELKTF